MSIKPKDIVVLDDSLAIVWEDGSESYINLSDLRKACPCANCSGETDVFGNLYINRGDKQCQNGRAQIMTFHYIGHYAIRIVWEDGHNGGIYSFNFLKEFNDQ
jgi:DUF971 family protein